MKRSHVGLEPGDVDSILNKLTSQTPRGRGSVNKLLEKVSYALAAPVPASPSTQRGGNRSSTQYTTSSAYDRDPFIQSNLPTVRAKGTARRMSNANYTPTQLSAPSSLTPRSRYSSNEQDPYALLLATASKFLNRPSSAPRQRRGQQLSSDAAALSPQPSNSSSSTSRSTTASTIPTTTPRSSAPHSTTAMLIPPFTSLPTAVGPRERLIIEARERSGYYSKDIVNLDRSPEPSSVPPPSSPDAVLSAFSSRVGDIPRYFKNYDPTLRGTVSRNDFILAVGGAGAQGVGTKEAIMLAEALDTKGTGEVAYMPLGQYHSDSRAANETTSPNNTVTSHIDSDGHAMSTQSYWNKRHKEESKQGLASVVDTGFITHRQRHYLHHKHEHHQTEGAEYQHLTTPITSTTTTKLAMKGTNGNHELGETFLRGNPVAHSTDLSMANDKVYATNTQNDYEHTGRSINVSAAINHVRSVVNNNPQRLLRAFDRVDGDRDGIIRPVDARRALRELGVGLSDHELKAVVADVAMSDGEPFAYDRATQRLWGGDGEVNRPGSSLTVTEAHQMPHVGPSEATYDRLARLDSTLSRAYATSHLRPPSVIRPHRPGSTTGTVSYDSSRQPTHLQQQQQQQHHHHQQQLQSLQRYHTSHHHEVEPIDMSATEGSSQHISTSRLQLEETSDTQNPGDISSLHQSSSQLPGVDHASVSRIETGMTHKSPTTQSNSISAQGPQRLTPHQFLAGMRARTQTMRAYTAAVAATTQDDERNEGQGAGNPSKGIDHFSQPSRYGTTSATIDNAFNLSTRDTFRRAPPLYSAERGTMASLLHPDAYALAERTSKKDMSLHGQGYLPLRPQTPSFALDERESHKGHEAPRHRRSSSATRLSETRSKYMDWYQVPESHQQATRSVRAAEPMSRPQTPTGSRHSYVTSRHPPTIAQTLHPIDAQIVQGTEISKPSSAVLATLTLPAGLPSGYGAYPGTHARGIYDGHGLPRYSQRPASAPRLTRSYSVSHLPTIESAFAPLNRRARAVGYAPSLVQDLASILPPAGAPTRQSAGVAAVTPGPLFTQLAVSEQRGHIDLTSTASGGISLPMSTTHAVHQAPRAVEASIYRTSLLERGHGSRTPTFEASRRRTSGGEWQVYPHALHAEPVVSEGNQGGCSETRGRTAFLSSVRPQSAHAAVKGSWSEVRARHMAGSNMSAILDHGA